MTPSRAIKLKCRDCTGDQPECINCSLMDISLTNLKKIRAYCVFCMNGNKAEIKVCTSPDCAFFIYRFGKNPRRKGIGGNFSSKVEKAAVS